MPGNVVPFSALSGGACDRRVSPGNGTHGHTPVPSPHILGAGGGNANHAGWKRRKASSWQLQPWSSKGMRQCCSALLQGNVMCHWWDEFFLSFSLCKDLEASMDPSGSLWDRLPSAATHAQLKNRSLYPIDVHLFLEDFLALCQAG